MVLIQRLLLSIQSPTNTATALDDTADCSSAFTDAGIKTPLNNVKQNKISVSHVSLLTFLSFIHKAPLSLENVSMIALLLFPYKIILLSFSIFHIFQIYFLICSP